MESHSAEPEGNMTDKDIVIHRRTVGGKTVGVALALLKMGRDCFSPPASPYFSAGGACTERRSACLSDINHASASGNVSSSASTAVGH